ncbi:MAG TPA: hypothetical protein VIY29_30145 [Ktedonobacteraceae bacterium]
MGDEQEQDSSPLMPTEQQTIMFYGKPLVVVRLPDGRPGIVLRNLCDNLQLEPTSQVRRIKRTEAIADDLVYAQVQTDCGPQIMPLWCFMPLHFGLLALIRNECARRFARKSCAISEKPLMSYTPGRNLPK